MKRCLAVLLAVLMAVALCGCVLLHRHAWTDATCTEPKTCTVCGKTEGEALGHTWKDATCTEPKTCSVCGATEGEALGHTWTEATCTEPKTCSVCGATEGEALGHTWVEATCTEPKTCSVCGAVEGEALGHTWVEATCTEPKTCSVCGAVEGEALGHTWTEATCTEPKTCSVCGAVEGEALGHTWTEATCTEPKTCSVCGLTEGEALGHTWKEATRTEPKTCTVCGATEGDVLPDSWADIDMDFFREVISSDITSLHQLVKDPSRYGIDYDSVERTLGTYQQDENREWYAFEEEILARMDALDYDALSDQDKLAYDTLRQYVEWDLRGEEFYGYYEPLTPYTGIQADLPLVFWFYDLNNKQDVEDYLTLLADVPRFFEDLLQYEQYRAKELGLFMIEANLRRVLEDLDEIINARDTIFLIPLFNESIEKVEGLTEEEINAYKERNLALLTNEFHQAFVDLKAGLEALRPYCRAVQGVKETGDEKYIRWFEYMLEDSCGDNMSPDEIAKLLKNSYKECVTRMRQSMQKGGNYPNKFSLGTVEENVEYLHKILDPLLPELPEVNVRYEEVAEELQEVASPAFYMIPSFDDWQNNMIGLNDPQSATNLLSTLAHEGFNGHLFQYVYHRSMPGLSLSQQLLETTAYAEAWSQYSEYLLSSKADSTIKVYDMRTYQAFSQMGTELLGYLSIRVNLFGDSFGTAYEMFSTYFGYSDDLFKGEIYEPFIIGHPFYYMPYAYGYARLTSLVSAARKTIGMDKFDEKAFYTQYLNYGPSYFNLLADRLAAWESAQ